ncbi:MAG: aspartate--ammonia ligase [Clostridia bacterium]|nr:aspartate--ammonia ligase [Clostridia bacterium]
MSQLIIPKGYKSLLNKKETQKAIKTVKDTFQKTFSKGLSLDRITAPLFVTKESGINDDLNGVERKVSFTIKNLNEKNAEVVQSLAKWKRQALYKYGYEVGEGIYTDMNAIRRDDDVDNMHSIFVDQWDWEKVISKEQRNFDFLKDVVRKIVNAIVDAQEEVCKIYPQLTFKIDREVFFITTQELEDMYPNLTPKQRENEIIKKHHTIFLMQIGDLLKSGIKHDGRAPDYDDWQLNGDIIFYNEILDCAFEISSMGIRVNSVSLKEQLIKCNLEEREKFDFHKNILNNVYPLTIGGGIGQSRLCMFILRKAHIGEVHVSVWPDDMIKECSDNGINLL